MLLCNWQSSGIDKLLLGGPAGKAKVFPGGDPGGKLDWLGGGEEPLPLEAQKFALGAAQRESEEGTPEPLLQKSSPSQRHPVLLHLWGSGRARFSGLAARFSGLLSFTVFGDALWRLFRKREKEREAERETAKGEKGSVFLSSPFILLPCNKPNFLAGFLFLWGEGEREKRNIQPPPTALMEFPPAKRWGREGGGRKSDLS